MRRFLFLLPLFLLSKTAFSQMTPDTAVAKKTGVKQVVILRLDEGFPPDTQIILTLEHGWAYQAGMLFSTDYLPGSGIGGRVVGAVQPNYNPSSRITRDSTGRIIYDDISRDDEQCVNDSHGIAYSYDTKGRLSVTKFYSCSKGITFAQQHYDSAGNVILWTNDPPNPHRLATRIEYGYDSTGRLVSEVNWFAVHPHHSVRDSADNYISGIYYSYDMNGLITEAIAEDPLHSCYCPKEWGWSESVHRTGTRVTFRYIYIY
jgi:hypothetical protein